MGFADFHKIGSGSGRDNVDADGFDSVPEGMANRTWNADGADGSLLSERALRYKTAQLRWFSGKVQSRKADFGPEERGIVDYGLYRRPGALDQKTYNLGVSTIVVPKANLPIRLQVGSLELAIVETPREKEIITTEFLVISPKPEEFSIQDNRGFRGLREGKTVTIDCEDDRFRLGKEFKGMRVDILPKGEYFIITGRQADNGGSPLATADAIRMEGKISDELCVLHKSKTEIAAAVPMDLWLGNMHLRIVRAPPGSNVPYLLTDPKANEKSEGMSGQKGIREGSGSSILVGRSAPDTNSRFSFTDGVSRSHLRITLIGGMFTFEDYSTNGTVILAKDSRD